MIRSFSLKSNSSRKHFTVQLSPSLTEEYTLDHSAIVDDLLTEIINKHPELSPSTSSHELHVTNFKSRKVNWGTHVKNLIKEQFTLTLDPPLPIAGNGVISPKTTPRSGSTLSSSNGSLTSPSNSASSFRSSSTTSNKNGGDNSTDKLVDELTSPRIKGVGIGQHLMNNLNSAAGGGDSTTTTTNNNNNSSNSTTTTATSDGGSSDEAPKVSLHLLLNKLTGKVGAGAADASSDSMHNIMRNASVIKVNKASPILFGGLLENHFPAHSSISIDSIPPILEKMLTYLKQERVQRTAGIFRLTGSSMEKERYIQILNEAQGKNGDLSPIVFPNSIDPNIICNLTLEYFKSLDRALFEPFQKFVEISEQTSEIERINMIKREIEDMNQTCKNVIRELFFYFVQVLLYKEENRLSVKSLSVVLGPVLLRGKVKEDEEVNAIQATADNKKGTVSATKLITTRQLSQKMVDFYCKTVGTIIDNYSSIFQESDMDHHHHHKRPKNKDKSSNNNNMMGTKTLDAFIQKLQDHKQHASASSSSLSLKRPGDMSNSSSSSSIFSPREPKKPTTKNEEEWEGIQKSWMQFVESWKKKYQDEKLAHDQTLETIKSTRDEIEFEKSQIKEQLATLREQLDEKKKYITQKRLEWDLQREQIALNWENEKVELEKEKSKRTKEIQESRDQFKKTLEYYSITNFQIDIVMGDEDDETISKMASNSAPPGAARVSTEENPAETGDAPIVNRNTSRSVIGQKIAVDSRFKKKTDNTTTTSQPPQKNGDGSDEDDSSEDEDANAKNRHKPAKSVLFNDLDDKTPQSSSINKTTPASSVFLPTTNKKKQESSSEEDDSGLSKRCGACKKKITGEFMETSDSYFHKHCFTCANCTKEIAGPFANLSGKFWCASCIQNKNKHVKYQTKEDTEKKKPAAASGDNMECSACKEKIINKADMVKALSKTYHKQCFVCQKCGNDFENMKFYDLMGDPVCATCKRKSIKSKAVSK